MLYANGLPYSPDLYVTRFHSVTITQATQLILPNNRNRVYLSVIRNSAFLPVNASYWFGGVGTGQYQIPVTVTVFLEYWWDVHKTLMTKDLYVDQMNVGDNFSIAEVYLNIPQSQENYDAIRKPETLAAKMYRLGKSYFGGSVKRNDNTSE